MKTVIAFALLAAALAAQEKPAPALSDKDTADYAKVLTAVVAAQGDIERAKIAVTEAEKHAGEVQQNLSKALVALQIKYKVANCWIGIDYAWHSQTGPCLVKEEEKK
jgi:hypothetical protein